MQRPILHHRPPLSLEHLAAPVGRFGLIADCMAQRHVGKLARGGKGDITRRLLTRLCDHLHDLDINEKSRVATRMIDRPR